MKEAVNVCKDCSDKECGECIWYLPEEPMKQQMDLETSLYFLDVIKRQRDDLLEMCQPVKDRLGGAYIRLLQEVQVVDYSLNNRYHLRGEWQ